ncbi:MULTISPECIES: zf-HC2 domain-containing protein [Bacillaceae]|uniref:Anti-sigma-W factor RsiW n=1 Tax=Evansella alkalicola TaxID=745819 RepID=A0ABS6JP11_9BACI|nr:MULTISPECIES: zf-HC2 domain-containing protein [Bacillaceae]MBU9720175.1 zf-HC2 domain-containing protein [Bacillus alkalicola]
MACENEYSHLIHKYLDEEMTLLEKKKLENHLLHCADCSGHLRELRKTVAIVQSASHMEAPKDFTANVMKQLPKETRTNQWKTWTRRHPYLITAAVFFLVFIMSVSSIWTGGQKEIIVQGDGHFVVDEERGVVIIPEGEVISGDITVRNGDIEIAGEVNGSITVINGELIYSDLTNGENYLASTGHVAGEINEINQVFGWLWFHIKSFFSDVINVFN